jgi:hypothetical protein
LLIDTLDSSEAELGVIEALELPETTATTKVNLPCRIVRPYTKNNNFAGRRGVIDEIRSALSPGQGRRDFRKIFALCGSGGVGKTQTALTYVFEAMEEFQAVLWTHSSTQTRLLECFAGFAVELGLISGEDEALKDSTACADILMRWLNMTGMGPKYVLSRTSLIKYAYRNTMALDP